MPDASFRKSAQAAWITQLHRFDLSKADAFEWPAPERMGQITELCAAFSKAYGHWFMPEGGGLDIRQVSHRGVSLDLKVDYEMVGTWSIRLRPRSLRFTYIADDPASSFFRLLLDEPIHNPQRITRRMEDGHLVRDGYSGSLLLASKVSFWNQIPAAYDGLHLRVSDDDIR